MNIRIHKCSAGEGHNYSWQVFLPTPAEYFLEETTGEFGIEKISVLQGVSHGFSRTKIGAKRAAKKVARRYVEDDWYGEQVANFNYLRGRVINEV